MAGFSLIETLLAKPLVKGSKNLCRLCGFAPLREKSRGAPLRERNPLAALRFGVRKTPWGG